MFGPVWPVQHSWIIKQVHWLKRKLQEKWMCANQSYGTVGAWRFIKGGIMFSINYH
jgi:hypothetical protein